MDEYLELLRNFEMKKRTIDADSEGQVAYRVPFKMLEVVLEMKSESLKQIIKNSKYSEQVDLSGDKMRLSANLFRSFFDTSINSIVLHLEDLLRKPENADVEAILMVGGYSESPLLQQKIRQKFNNLKIIIPGEAGLAVLKGAVIFGHDSTVIRERVSKYTYGTDILGDEISPGNFTDHRFDKLITNGQILVVGKTQKEKKYHPTQEEQKSVEMNIYVTRDKHPKYVTDLGCQKIGSFEVPISGQGLDRWVTARIIFGGTEIDVVCIEDATGKETRSKFAFLQ